MQERETFNRRDKDPAEPISWSDTIITVWRARWAILVITALVMAGGLAVSELLVQYESQGFFQFGGAIPLKKEKDRDTYKGKTNAAQFVGVTGDKGDDKGGDAAPGIALPDFKRYAALYGTSERFSDYVREQKLDSAAGIDELREVFLSRNGISKLIEPVYSVTKRDVRELLAQSKDVASSVIGLQINYEARSPENAQQMVGLLGRYAMDSIIYLIYADELRFKPEETKTAFTKLDNVIIRHRKALEAYNRRAADLRQIAGRNPRASASEQRTQQVLITDETARYLLPSTLLMATEVQVSEANEAILSAKREQLQNALLLEYYESAQSMLKFTKSGETILRSLEPLKASVFKGKNLQDNVVKEVYNRITVENETAMNLYLDKSRFISGPTLPRHTTARPLMALALSMILGIVLALLFVFGRKWWRENQARLT